MKGIIVDDEARSRRLLQALCMEYCDGLEIIGLADSVSEAKKLIDQEMPDVVFLDIRMPIESGFELLKFYNNDFSFEVIFTTAYDGYAVEAFQFSAIDYLLKPIDKKELQKALQKYTKTIEKSNNRFTDIEAIRHLFKKEYKRRFMVKVGNQFSTFNVEDIAYFMADNGIIFLLNKKGRKFPIEYSIDQLEEILNPIHFFRINRKYMVSVEAVKEIHSYFNSRLSIKVIPNQEEQIIVSRERTTNFKKWLDT